MSKRTFLDMMGEIDDAYIEEAAHSELILQARRRQRIRSVTKFGAIAACVVIAVGLTVAAPYMARQNFAESDEMSVIIQDSLSNQNASSAANKADLTMQYEDSSASISQAAEAASSALAEAEKKAEEASKEASKALSEAGRTDRPDSQAAMSKPMAESNAQSPVTGLNSYRVDGMTFYYSTNTLRLLELDHAYALTKLTIPSQIGDMVVLDLGVDFWSFCENTPNLVHVTIPDSIKLFGDVSKLSRSVTIFTPAGSVAEAFFSAAGFTVVST